MLVARAQGDEADQVDGPLESIFAKELARRGYSPGSSLSSVDIEEGTAVAEKPASPFAPASSSQSPFQSATKTSPRSSTKQQPSSTGAEGQRERSMALVSEGLEGLIPRATELLKLGGSVFLAFLPFIAGISILFGAIYLVMGDSFVHGGGVHSGPPPYVDPEKLLSEPTLDPYIPFR